MSMADRDGVIWLDDDLLPWRDAKVHVLTHTLHYGLGVFEGLRAYKTTQNDKVAIFRLEEHTRRLFRSAAILGMKIPHDADTLNKVCARIILATVAMCARCAFTAPRVWACAPAILACTL